MSRTVNSVNPDAMSKLTLVTFITTVLLLASTNNSQITLAETCASQCGAVPIRFTPGQYIRVEIVNSTYNLVKIENLPEMNSISLQPGQKFQLQHTGGTQPNVSLLFWNETGWPLQAVVSQPNFGTLHLEIRPGRGYPGDRSVYILNDGRVEVF